MNDNSISISEQHAGRDILNIVGDLNINQKSPSQDIIKIIFVKGKLVNIVVK